MKKLITPLLLALGLIATKANLPLYEPFTYKIADPLIGQMHPSGYVWLGPNPAPLKQPRIDRGNLYHGGLALPIPERVIMHGGAVMTASLPFAADALGAPGGNQDYPKVSGSVYFSLLLRVMELGPLDFNGDFFAALTPFVDASTAPMSGTVGYVRVFLRNAGGGTFNIGMSKASSVPADIGWHPVAFVTNTTQLIVGEYRFLHDGDIAYLWINPDYSTFCTAAPPPDLWNLAGPDASDLGSFTYYQRSSLDTPATLLTDELRLATLWTDVLASGVDYGDADPAFPVTYAEDGARHFLVPGMYLGTGVDADCDGEESANADGDDLVDGNDDEDGVTYPSSFVRGKTETITVVASTNGVLDAWVDWNGDGDWGDAGERVFTAEPLVSTSPNTLEVPVPLGATLGTAQARFRFSETGVATPKGLAPNGEVEDYAFKVSMFQIAPIDLALWGDRPTINMREDENYELTLTVSNKGPNIASNVQVTATLPATVQLQSIILRGEQSCQASDGIVTCQLANLNPGDADSLLIVILARADMLPGDETASLGEVIVEATAAGEDLHPENNRLGFPGEVTFAQDWGDAPEGYAVTADENGARHRRGGGLHLGSLWDPEGEGTHSAGADYDDNNGAAADDEDGIAWVSTKGTITVDVTVTGNGYLNAWFDFYRNLNWNDAGEQVLIDQALTTGTTRFFITVPAGIAAGDFVSRWRYSETAGLSPRNKGGKGEVEDYVVTWTPESPRINFSGLGHTTRGSTEMSVTPEGLQISHLNSNNDAVRIDLGRSQGWSTSIETPVVAFTTVYSINIVGFRQQQGTQLGSSLTIRKDHSALALAVDYTGIGANQYVAKFYTSDGSLVGSTAATSLSIPIVGEDCGSGEIEWCRLATRTDPFGQKYLVLLCHCIRIVGPNGPISDISVIEISAVAATSNPDYITAVEISGTGDGSITLADESIRQFDLWHRVVGEASVDVAGSAPGLTVQSAGSGQEIGIETLLGGPEYIGENYKNSVTNNLRNRVVKEFSDDSNPGFTLPGLGKFLAVGQAQGASFFDVFTEISVSAEPQGGGGARTGSLSPTQEIHQLRSQFDAMGATRMQVEVFNGADHVGTVELPVGDIGSISGGPLTSVGAQVIDDGMLWSLVGAEMFFRAVDGSLAVSCDRLCVSPLDSSVRLAGLRSLITQRADGESISIRNVSTALPRAPRLRVRLLEDEPKVAITVLNTKRDEVYRLESKENLNQPHWHPMRLIGGTGLPITILDDTSARMRFYRLRAD